MITPTAPLKRERKRRAQPITDATLDVLGQATDWLTVDQVRASLGERGIHNSYDSVSLLLRKLEERGLVSRHGLIINNRTRAAYRMPTTGGPEPDTPVSDVPAARPPSDPAERAASMLGLDLPSTRYALWDDGTLMIYSGDDLIALAPADTVRLRQFLAHAEG